MNTYEMLGSRYVSHQRKKSMLWGCSLSLLVVAIVAFSCVTIIRSSGGEGGVVQPKPTKPRTSVVSRAVVSTCKDTLYRELCESSLRLSSTDAPPKTSGEVFDLSVKLAISQAESARSLAFSLSLVRQKQGTTHHYSITAMDDCIELLDDSLDHLNNVLDPKKNPSPNDIQTWLSAALTNQDTCLESLQNYKFSTEKDMMDGHAKNLSQLISNSLALYKTTKRIKDAKIPNLGGGGGGGGRRLLTGDDKFPAWLSKGERKLLETSIKDIEANAVVAQDGSGTHTTIAEAIASVSLVGGGGGRTVIHLKAGTYNENINIPTKQKNVMLVGDGKGVTVIVGSKNAEQGSTTFRSATVAAMGEGFIARDITFVNNAGPAKHQAVALRVGADKSVIYRCSIVGYQDTLYTHSNRQFYRDTDIYGTVDFIFGNSAVVFQNCNIFVRKGMSSQKSFVTAQGRKDPNQNTGISIHNCKIVAASDAKGQQSTYLGRPWQRYSRTVIMQSYLDDCIHPAGWFPWSGSFALSTLYYGEYMNSGPGSSTSGRVSWSGYHPSLATAEATKFTVTNFIAGNLWLPSTGVAFDSGLHG
ncbi:PREDICTED: pectinesterase-like [Nelumbo nucifera]|uniref:Pectinesterase n=1 Tax=Nelumbo nucifera TaxID=4432 RepID=A0A1U8AHV5_NELNU|nr:PREDICTED: pectinesterase-like [Nelumbo nucifera]